MFGSDWPVSTLAVSYRGAVAMARMMTSQLDLAEREAIFTGTAMTAYGLRPPARSPAQ